LDSSWVKFSLQRTGCGMLYGILVVATDVSRQQLQCSVTMITGRNNTTIHQ